MMRRRLRYDCQCSPRPFALRSQMGSKPLNDFVKLVEDDSFRNHRSSVIMPIMSASRHKRRHGAVTLLQRTKCRAIADRDISSSSWLVRRHRISSAAPMRRGIALSTAHVDEKRACRLIMSSASWHCVAFISYRASAIAYAI